MADDKLVFFFFFSCDGCGLFHGIAHPPSREVQHYDGVVRGEGQKARSGRVGVLRHAVGLP